MRFVPQIQAFFDAAPAEPLDFLTVPEQRQLIRHLSDLNYLRFGRRAEPVAAVTDYAVPAAHGEITVRAYRPGGAAPLPAHLELHGGGWWLGSIDEHINDAVCRYRCVHARCVVLAVEYRLAPEHPFPAAVDDAYAALCWVAGHAGDLGIDAERISVGGTSAGGNLAAVLTLRARDEGGPALAFQLLDVPALDLTGDSARAVLATEEFTPLARRGSAYDVTLGRYLPEPADALLPFASPLRAPDLSGLPPAHIMTAEYDPLREEGERYGRALAAAGVPVTVTRHAGAIHGAGYLTRVWPPAQEWQHEAAIMLRQAHERAAGPGDRISGRAAARRH